VRAARPNSILGLSACFGLLPRRFSGSQPSRDSIKKHRQSLRAAELKWSFPSWFDGLSFINAHPRPMG